ncbi:MAG: AtpZ/AtpI family protein [Pseudomonadota bacterium]
MQPEDKDATIKALQDRIAVQKHQAGLEDDTRPIPETGPTDQANNLQIGIRAGTEFVGSMLGGGLFGWLIDTWLDSAPIGMIAGVLVGVIIAFWNLYKLTLPGASSPLQ